MNTMNKLVLAATATVTLGTTASSTAYAGSSLNGPQLTGIAVQSLEAQQPIITMMTLPAGDALDLHRQAMPLDDTTGPRRRATN